MKIPVPMVEPMPKADSWTRPIERERSPWPVSAPVSSVMAVTGFRRRICCLSDAIDPSLDQCR